MNTALLKNLCLTFFFTGLLFIGLTIYSDYGVHTDEYNNQNFGNSNLQYIQKIISHHSLTKIRPLNINNHNSSHGAIIETLLSLLSESLHLKDSRDVILFRHLCCYLIFLGGVFFFYKLCSVYFKNWLFGLLGCLLLVLSPPIFANAFYNTSDISFLSSYILCMYTFHRWIERKSTVNTLIHALACALSIGIRPIGMIIPFISMAFIVHDTLADRSAQSIKDKCVNFCSYAFLLIFFILCTWPILWPHPLIRLDKLIQYNLNCEVYWKIHNLYLGKVLFTQHLPWHYAPLWLVITTPLIYTFYFMIGLIESVRILLNRSNLIPRRNIIFIIACFLLPIIITEGKVYNGWRHLFFIYPAYLLISLLGLSSSWRWLSSKLSGLSRVITQTLLSLILSICLLSTAYFMFSHHPFQYLYFNKLAGTDMQKIQHNFDLDYWGLSYKQALEHILSKNPDQIILLEDFGHLSRNLKIIPLKDRLRVKLVPMNEAQFLVTKYIVRQNDLSLDLDDKISIDGASLIKIYKLHPNQK